MTSTHSPGTQTPAGSTGSGSGSRDTADGTASSARPSIGDLVSTLSEKLSLLVRDEIRLAKVELAEKGKHAAAGGGMLAGAAFFAVTAFSVLVATAILGLVAAGLAPWLAALIVAVVLLIIAAVLGAAGKKALEKGSPPVPAKAQASIKADVAAVKEGLSS